MTFQAEDEIAAIGALIGAAYGGALSVTASSGPGVALKGEAIGLAVMTELPVVIVNVQRGGPSTGLPTKTEQSDLSQALYGRNGEAPIPVIAARSPGDCFYAAVEALKVASRYMVPVMLLSDGYIANGSEPWPVPDVTKLDRFDVHHPTDPTGFHVYERDPATLARAWAIPGTAGFEHRIGGIEKDSLTGNISYDPANHEKMVHTRAAKIERIAQVAGRRVPRGMVPVNLSRALLNTPGFERLTRSPRAFVDRLATRARYANSGTRALLAAHGVECPAFEDYVGPLVGYVQSRLEARRQRAVEVDVDDPLA